MRLAQTLLVIIAGACILGIGIGLWRVLDATESVINQGRLMLGSIRGTTMDIHKAAQDGIEQQKKVVKAFVDVSDAVVRNLDRVGAVAAAKMGLLADRVDQLATSLDSQGAAVLCELSETIRVSREEIVSTTTEARASLAAIRPVMADASGVLVATRDGISGMAEEAQSAIAATQPVFQVLTATGEQAERGVAAVSNVLEYYERKFTHPSKWEKVKAVITFSGMFMNNIGFPLWALLK